MQTAQSTDALHTDVAQCTQCFTVIVIVIADVVEVVVYFLRHCTMCQAIELGS